MSLRTYILLILIILASSSASIVLLLFYMNPDGDVKFSFTLMGVAIFLACASILSLLLFFLKKIYYRGDVFISTMNASVRQSVLISSALVTMGILYMMGIFEQQLVLMVWASVLCFEVMLQTLD